MSRTCKEVARQAGVSVATVSRVLNGKGPVREDTRRRVLQVAERLRYVPHGAARSLITRTTSTVGVLLPDIYGDFFSEVIRGIDAAARGSGYHLLVSGSHEDKGEIAAVIRAMRGRVDGLIVMSPDVEARNLQRNLPEALPIVFLNCLVDGSSFDSITTDNYGGAFAMTRHLLGLGHRRIAHIAGSPDNYDARERLRGYRDAVRAASPRPRTLEFEGDFTEESGHRAGQRLLQLSERPTAVFAANDSMAIGCLSSFREKGVRVPEEVAVAGFDDIPIARFVAPPLSSVHVSIAQLGARALERLLEALRARNEHRRRHETLPATLVIRSSCGAAAKQNEFAFEKAPIL